MSVHKCIVVRHVSTGVPTAYLALNEPDQDRQLDGIRRTYGAGYTVAIEEMSTL